jgi:[acyl-carrier-protein] S-malonyltransferase
VGGALKLTDGLYLVQARGDLMADCAAHHRGGMLALIGLGTDAVQSICEESEAYAANYNTADQVVLSGTLEAIEKAERLAKAQGAKRAVKLEVAGAFHSPLMQPAAEKFRHVLAKVEIQSPGIPVISNVTGLPVRDPEDIRRLLVRQIVSPVLWEPSMRYLIQAGATHAIEFPPARVLTGLLRKIDASVKAIAIDEPEDIEKLNLAVSS